MTALSEKMHFTRSNNPGSFATSMQRRFGSRIHACKRYSTCWSSSLYYPRVSRIRSAQLSGLRGKIISARSMTYDLRRLKLHGLVEKLAGTRRYRVTQRGLRLAMFFTRTYDRLLRPGLATIIPHLNLDDSRLRTALRHFEDAVKASCADARLAA